ncbi:MAG: hypothetical protein KA401_00655 [Anaerolineae bacterium]|nr:hypothetical protein [Anaerolineae bacterium]
MYWESVIGYDVRELWLNNQVGRTDELIRTSIKKPLSVDNSVWFSLFVRPLETHLWPRSAAKSEYRSPYWQEFFDKHAELTKPNFYYGHKRLWLELSKMKEHISQHWPDTWRPSAIVAVTDVFDTNPESGDIDPFVIPQIIHPNWKCLGYDVASGDLFSGLMNNESSLDDLRDTEWKLQLNEYHLFDDVTAAFRFCSIAEQRMTDHTPQYVYGLYLIETVNAEFP